MIFNSANKKSWSNENPKQINNQLVIVLCDIKL